LATRAAHAESLTDGILQGPTGPGTRAVNLDSVRAERYGSAISATLREMPRQGRHRTPGARPSTGDPRLHQALLAETEERCPTDGQHLGRQGNGYAARARGGQRGAGTWSGGP